MTTRSEPRPTTVVALTAGAPATVRAHAAVRAATCPLHAVVEAVRGKRRVLDVGCGFGVLAGLLALDGPDREVLGFDIDAAKVEGAARLVKNVEHRGGRLRIVASAEATAGPFDAIVVVDVLYLLPTATRAEILADWTTQLAPGGVLVIKEMAERPRWKARWNLAQETLAVRALRWTSGAVIAPPAPESVRAWMTAAGLRHEGRAVDRGYLHPHYLHVGHAPAT